MAVVMTRRKKQTRNLSDISRMPVKTEAFIVNNLPPTDVLILDALSPGGNHPTHYDLKHWTRLKPRLPFLVGMACDSFLPNDEMNSKLKELDVQIKFAHDGLFIECGRIRLDGQKGVFTSPTP